MPPDRHKRSRTIKPHSKWKTGDFEIVSKNSVSFKIVTYRLQTWSATFENMLETGNGIKRIELDEHSSTIEHFFNLMTDGEVKFAPVTDFPYIDQVVALAQFLDKYECTFGLKLFSKFLRSADAKVPPLCVYLVGVALSNSDLYLHPFNDDSYLRGWSSYRAWQRPSGAPQDDSPMMHPRHIHIPAQVYARIPASHLWVLSNLELPQTQQGRKVYLPGASYICLLEQFKHQLRRVSSSLKSSRTGGA